MTRAEFNISCNYWDRTDGNSIEIKKVKGYVVEYRGYWFGIHKNENKYEATELTTGFRMPETEAQTIEQTVLNLKKATKKRLDTMNAAISSTKKYLKKKRVKFPVNN